MIIESRIAERIRLRRQSLGLTQAELGARIGVRFQQIHRYEHALSRIGAVQLWQLAGVLEVPVSYFFDGLQDPRPGVAPDLRNTAQIAADRLMRLSEPRRLALLDLLSAMLEDSPGRI